MNCMHHLRLMLFRQNAIFPAMGALGKAKMSLLRFLPKKQHTLINLLRLNHCQTGCSISSHSTLWVLRVNCSLKYGLWHHSFDAETVVDFFSGSGIVGYMFKAQGKTVISNDYMAMSATFTKGNG